MAREKGETYQLRYILNSPNHLKCSQQALKNGRIEADGLHCADCNSSDFGLFGGRNMSK